MAKKRAYNDMSEAALATQAAPELPYGPPRPRKYNPPIGLIGCGGISASHLKVYKAMGLNVVALCDIIEQRAKDRAAEFFPDAAVYADYKQLLKRDDIEVVDCPLHPQDRAYVLPDVLRARKHALSQKPFALDLDLGHRLIDLADKMGVTLAVNQNGRWSPHWSWVRHAIAKGLIGDVASVHLNCHWNHDEWIRTTHFDRIHHIVLYDYAIHWFDALASFMPGREAKTVFATLNRAPGQLSTPPMLGQCLVEFDQGQGSLVFDGSVRFGGGDDGFVYGSRGTLRYAGPSINAHGVEWFSAKGVARPELRGEWMTEGFMGSMGELLSAIEKKRVPSNNPVDNLRGLAICFAAVVSAETGKPKAVGSVRKLPLKTCMVADPA